MGSIVVDKFYWTRWRVWHTSVMNGTVPISQRAITATTTTVQSCGIDVVQIQPLHHFAIDHRHTGHYQKTADEYFLFIYTFHPVPSMKRESTDLWQLRRLIGPRRIEPRHVCHQSVLEPESHHHITDMEHDPCLSVNEAIEMPSDGPSYSILSTHNWCE